LTAPIYAEKVKNFPLFLYAPTPAAHVVAERLLRQRSSSCGGEWEPFREKGRFDIES